MATIAALVVEMGVNTAVFKSDMTKARTALRSSASKMNRALASIERGFGKVIKRMGRFAKRAVSLRGAIGVLVGGAGLGLLVKRSIDAADTIGKTADAIGISTDALQEYRFAADLSGVETEKLDRAFLILGKRIGELRTRTDAELVTALKKLNPRLLETLKNTSGTEQAMGLAFRTMVGLKNQTDRLAVATAFFGRSGATMTNLVRAGTEALERMRARARELGLVIEERLIRNAEAAKDKLTILGTVIRIKVTEAVISLSGEIGALAEAATNALPKIVRLFREAGEAAGLIDRPLNKRLVENARAIAEERARLKKSVLAGLGLDPGRIELNLFTFDTDKIIQFRTLNDLIVRRRGLMEGLRREAEKASVAQSAALTGTNPAANDNRSANLGIGRGLSELLDRSGSATAIERQITRRRDLTRAVEEGRAELDTLRRASENTGRAVDGLTDSSTAFGREISASLTDAVLGFGRAEDAALSFLRTIQQAILRQTVEKGVNKLVSSLLTVGLGALGGGGATGPGSTGFQTSIGTAGFNFGLAHGGTARRGEAHLVGERGPELFVPGRTGAVIPNNALAGGPTIHQTFNMDFRGAEPGVFAQADRFKDAVADEAMRRMLDAIGRGGAVAKAVGRRAA